MSVEVTMQHGYLLCAYMSDLLWQQMGLLAVGEGGCPHTGPDPAHKSCCLFPLISPCSMKIESGEMNEQNEK